MSEDPRLPLVRSIYAALNERDLASATALLESVPEFEWHPSPVDPYAAGGPLRGAEIIGQFQDLLDTFGHLTIEIDTVEPVGDALLLTVQENASGSESGVITDKEEFHVWEFRDGVPVVLREFATRDEAVAAARG